MKIAFLASGAFALPTLERLHALRRRYPTVRVVTRPETRGARGHKLLATPVKLRAEALGLPCDAPESANSPAYLAELESLGADLLLVADYGEILRRPLRELAPIGTFNLHGSLLPRHRGAAPVAHSILAGDTRTGVTLFRVEKAVDSGPIVDAAATEIGSGEHAGELEKRLAALAADLLARNLPAFADGSFTERPQDDSAATCAPKLTKRQAEIDWSRSAHDIERAVRAYRPWPIAFSHLHRRAPNAGRPDRTLFLRVRTGVATEPSTAEAAGTSATPAPGTVECVGDEFFRVRCGAGALEVLEVQRAGKSSMPVADYLRGRPLVPGDRFGAPRLDTPAEKRST